MELYGQNIGAVQIVAAEFKTSGKRNVFVQDNTNPMDYVPLGGAFKPMFNAGEKVFQGDLCEFSLDSQTIMVLRTFKVLEAVTATDTVVKVQGGAYKQQPHSGMNLMKAPSALSGTGTAGAITKVEAKTDSTLGDIYELTITANALGALAVGDILVEGKAVDASTADVVVLTVGTAPSSCAIGDKYIKSSDNKIYTATAANTWDTTGETPEQGKVYFSKANSKTYTYNGTSVSQVDMAKMLVANPNSFIKNDIVFNYAMNVAVDPAVNGAIVLYAPIQHAKCFKAKMQDLPACVLARNKSYIDGIFEL